MTTALTTELRDGTWQVLAERTTASFTARNWGSLKVRGTIPVIEGTVTVSGGRPVAAEAVLDPTGIATGIRRRDADLCGRRFLDTERNPLLTVWVGDVRPDGDGWVARARLAVRDREAPVDLTVRREADEADTVRIVATGVLDLDTTPIRVPRLMVGRYVEITVTASARCARPAPSPSA